MTQDPEYFSQAPPRLGNQYDEDRMLRSLLARRFGDRLAEVRPRLREMGALAGDRLYRLQLADRLNEPVLTRWDPWGRRVDDIAVTPLWQEARRLACEFGLVATGYDGQWGALSRTLQFALAYLFHPSTDVYTCPLAMSDGAARTLLQTGNADLIERAVGRLTSRDPSTVWTSGQWMTEATGGSDVGRSETVARPADDGAWQLFGRKWFTSAITSEMALTLARPEGNAAGGKGLALFYVETRRPDGSLNAIRVCRLKDKLGTRKVPTAELILEGSRAQLVRGVDHGIRDIVPMLEMTRTWNSICAAATLRRGVALARDYARRRIAFGRHLSEQPLHLDTLALLQADTECAFHLSFYLVDLIGRREAGELGQLGEAELRLLTSLAKLTTGRLAMRVVPEVLESFGGAGYVEDTGLPLLLRDAQVLPIWEGTTNVLALDLLRALEETDGPTPLLDLIARCRTACSDARLVEASAVSKSAASRAAQWFEQRRAEGRPEVLQAGARRLALVFGEAVGLALLCEHAQWALDNEGDQRPVDAASRLAARGPGRLIEPSEDASRRLAMDAVGAG
jgi:alkylation response protein AidB-like acyl-CoA dehydrogenase